MTFPEAHSLITFFGDAWGATETWQFGLRLDSGFTTSGEPTQTQLNTIRDAYATMHATASFSPTARYIGMKWAKIGEDGKYVGGGDSITTFLATPLGGGSGTGSSVSAFPQICVVVSLTTDRLRGYASRGRFYSAPTNLPVGSDGRLAVAAAVSLRDRAKTFLDTVNGAGLGPVTVYSNVGEGLKREVTGVRVGRVVDTMRSRRSSLDEDYQAVALSP